MAVVANQIGYCYEMLEKTPVSLDYYNKSLAAYRRFRDRPNEARLLQILGDVYYQTKQLPLALQSYDAARTIARETGDRLGEGVLCHLLGSVQDDSGAFAKSIALYEESLELLRSAGSAYAEAGTLYDMMVYWNNAKNPQRNTARAIFWGKQAATLCNTNVPCRASPRRKKPDRSNATKISSPLSMPFLSREGRDSEAEAVRALAGSDYASADPLPLTVPEQENKTAYEKAADAVSDAAKNGRALQAKKADTPESFDADDDKALTAAKAQLAAAREAFAAFLKTLHTKPIAAADTTSPAP